MRNPVYSREGVSTTEWHFHAANWNCDMFGMNPERGRAQELQFSGIKYSIISPTFGEDIQIHITWMLNSAGRLP